MGAEPIINEQPRTELGRWSEKPKPKLVKTPKLPSVKFENISPGTYSIVFSKRPGRDILDEMKSAAKSPKFDYDSKAWRVIATPELIEWSAKLANSGWIVEGGMEVDEEASKIFLVVADCNEQNRVLLYFDGFPSDELRSSLKASTRAIWVDRLKAWKVVIGPGFTEWLESEPQKDGYTVELRTSLDLAEAPKPTVSCLPEHEIHILDSPKKFGAIIKSCGGVWSRETPYGSDAWTIPPAEKKRVDPALVARDAQMMSKRLGCEADTQEQLYDSQIHRVSCASKSDSENLPVEPYPFQSAGVKFAVEQRHCLIADEPGLGKTWQAIGAIKEAGDFPLVVVCPRNVMTHWERSLRDSFPKASILKLDHTPTERWEDESYEYSDITIVPFSSVNALRGWAPAEPASLVVDEIHYAKSPDAQRSKALGWIAAGVPDDGMLIGISGTPMLQRPNELIQPLSVLRRIDEFGSPYEFLTRYNPVIASIRISKHKTVAIRLSEMHSARLSSYDLSEAQSMQEKLHKELHHKLTDGVMLRRKKVDVLPDLPEKMRWYSTIDLDQKMMSLYKDAEVDIIESLADTITEEFSDSAENEFENIDEVVASWEVLTDLQDMLEGISTGKNPKAIKYKPPKEKSSPDAALFMLRRLAAMCKVPDAIAMVEERLEAQPDEKIVLFAHHTAVVDCLATYFDAPKLSGSVGLEDRDAAIDAFQSDSPDSPKVLVYSTAVGPEGITLTKSHTGIFVEQPWNPALCDQAEDRLHRITQESKVSIEYLIAADTVDSDVADLVERKRGSVGMVLDGETPESTEHRPLAEELADRLVTRRKARKASEQ